MKQKAKLAVLIILTITSVILFLAYIAFEYLDTSFLPETIFPSYINVPFDFAIDNADESPNPDSLTCNQCVGGNFLMRRWLMQDDRVEQRMGWVDAWKETDCLQGLVNRLHSCMTSCVTVYLQRKVDVTKSIYDSVMMDCADDLIYNSPDIPISGYKYEPRTIEFTKNDTFVNDRTGFRITYNFTTVSSPNPQQLARELSKMVVSGLTVLKPTLETKFVYTIMFGVFVSLFILMTCLAWGFYIRRNAKDRALVVEIRQGGLIENYYVLKEKAATLTRGSTLKKGNVQKGGEDVVRVHPGESIATYHRAPLAVSEYDPLDQANARYFDSFDDEWDDGYEPIDSDFNEPPSDQAPTLEEENEQLPMNNSYEIPTKLLKAQLEEIKNGAKHEVKDNSNDETNYGHMEHESENADVGETPILTYGADTDERQT